VNGDFDEICADQKATNPMAEEIPNSAIGIDPLAMKWIEFMLDVSRIMNDEVAAVSWA
jgi:hypothetical protein